MDVLGRRRATSQWQAVWLVAALAVVAIVVEVVVSGVRWPGGPLGLGGEGRAEACISVVGDEVVAFGQQVQPTADLEVERAELLDTQGVELVDVVVMPLRGDAAAIGAMRLAGIEGDGPDGEGIPWDERVPAQGARLQAGTRYDVVVLLRGVGTTGVLRVEYRSGGARYAAEGIIVFELARSCA